MCATLDVCVSVCAFNYIHANVQIVCTHILGTRDVHTSSHLKDPVDVWKNALRYKGLTGHIRSSLDAFKRSS